MAEIHSKIGPCPTAAHISADSAHGIYVVRFTVPAGVALAPRADETYSDPAKADAAKQSWLATVAAAQVT